MKLSELIAALETVKDLRGDLPVCVWEGEVLAVTATSCVDGFACKFDEKPTEILLEFKKAWDY